MAARPSGTRWQGRRAARGRGGRAVTDPAETRTATAGFERAATGSTTPRRQLQDFVATLVARPAGRSRRDCWGAAMGRVGRATRSATNLAPESRQGAGSWPESEPSRAAEDDRCAASRGWARASTRSKESPGVDVFRRPNARDRSFRHRTPVESGRFGGRGYDHGCKRFALGLGNSSDIDPGLLFVVAAWAEGGLFPTGAACTTDSLIPRCRPFAPPGRRDWPRWRDEAASMTTTAGLAGAELASAFRREGGARFPPLPSRDPGRTHRGGRLPPVTAWPGCVGWVASADRIGS